MMREGMDDCAHDETSLKFGRLLAHPLPPEAIVVSGMSGAFPAARNIDEFHHKLRSKIDMITPTYREGFNLPDMPSRCGTLPDDIMTEFDAGYFGVHERMLPHCNPGNRIQLEKAIEAIHDAGMSPRDFENTRTGHFMGMCVNEKEFMLAESEEDVAWNMKATLKSLIASRISHHLMLKGPILISDTACSTSFHALDHAYRAIRQGECDAALVTSINSCLSPGTNLQFAWLGVLSPEGVCRVFDEKANGYARSEAVCAVLLQKAKDAKRIYAQVLHSKSNSDGFKERSITFPNWKAQLRLMDECCKESDVEPSDICFVEAHGTGTQAGDPEELTAIDKHIAQRRKEPLLIGAVKSSIGHTETAAGLCSLIKTILALEECSITPNIHFSKPINAPGLLEGRLKVVTEQTKIPEQAIAGVNSFGFGGSNAHVLLKSVTKMKVNGGKPTDNLPRLVCLSGRTKEAVDSLLDEVSKEPLDTEYVGLLQNSFRKDARNHLFKGYSIVSKEKEIKRSVAKVSLKKLPLCLVFGELDDWYSLANDFLEVPIFNECLEKIKSHLKKEGFDISDKLLNTNSKIRQANDRKGKSIISICIADTLKRLEIKPGAVAGNLSGKLVSAYYDERINIIQMLDSILNNNDISSTKQIIGKQKKEAKTAAVDSNTTLSNGVGHKKYCNGDSTSYFNEKNRPNVLRSQMIVIQVGEILEQSIFDEDSEILSFKTFTDFLSMIGRLYELGYTLPIEKLFPKVEFPVSRGTPMISSKIKWNHERKMNTDLKIQRSIQSVYDYKISLQNREWSFISGHVIDGRILFPAAGYLWLARSSIMKKHNLGYNITIPVSFKNCRFIRATQLSPGTELILTVTLSHSGYFEVTERESLIVSGEVYIIENTDNLMTTARKNSCSHIMTSKDVYKELKLRGYNYSDEFQRIEEIDIGGTSGQINWNNNWITFIDNAFQMLIVHSDTRLLYVPTSIAELNIYPSIHDKVIESLPNKETSTQTCIPAYYDPETKTIRSGGLEVTDLLATSINRKKYLASPVLEKYQFVPNITSLSLQESVKVNGQIILENSLSNKVKAVELIDDETSPDSDIISPILIEVLGNEPMIQTDISIFSQNPLETSVPVEKKKIGEQANNTLVIASKLLENPQKLKEVLDALKDEGYIIARESSNFDSNAVTYTSLTILTIHHIMGETLVLLKKKAEKRLAITFINIDGDEKQHWIDKVKSAMSADNEIILYSHKNKLSGLLGLVNCLRREPGGNNVKGVLIMDDSLEFVPDVPWCKDQLQKRMAINVFKNGTWGTYRHLKLEINEQVAHKHSYVNQLVKGDLSSLVWLEGVFAQDMAVVSKKSNFVEVNYAALNFKDVMVASGKISLDEMGSHRLDHECVLGFEFSGTNPRGQKFMGMVSQGALATSVLTDKFLVWKVPEEWSLAEAATVPVVYATVIYALKMRGQMKRGESILIHSGTGGIGQAAIGYALHHGCIVYTTVGNDEKRNFLKKKFPQLTDDHIGNSRDLSFERLIRKQTGGRGVDMVLNSLAEDKLLASVRCLADGGRFLEIGKFDILMNKPLCTMLLQKDASFHGIMLDRIIDAIPYQKSTLARLLHDGIRNGSVKPLNINVFKCDEIEKAFRFMTGGKHMGKVLIEVREEQSTPHHKDNRITSIPRYYCQTDKSYIIAGGLGGFGLELVDWLIMRGARKLVLSSRTSIRTGYQKSRLRIWKSYGIEVNICTADITTKRGCRILIEEAKKLGPVAAVFNLAVVLRDALFENQTKEMFEVSLAPKAEATKHLDELTREICPELSEFVTFSSVSCGRGNPGQTNYGMANSIMERICERRRKDGYHALSIQWGAIGEVGLVADMQEGHGELEISGTLQQRLQSCMEVLDGFLTQNSATIVASMVVAEKKIASSGEDIIDAVAAILGITDSKSVSIHTILPELGMDSMSAIEVKQLLERDMDLVLNVQEIRTLTFAKLMKIEEERRTQPLAAVKESQEEGIDYIIGTFPSEEDCPDTVLELTTALEKDEDGPTIFMIPGIEGYSTTMITLASKLNAHVHSFQYDYGNPIDTIEELVKIYLKYIKGVLTDSKPFCIVAHSYGVILAVEIMNILETEGYTGILVAIDGGPAFKQIASNLGDSVAEWETAVIYQMLVKSLPPVTVSSHLKQIVACTTTEERIEKATDILEQNMHNSRGFIKNVTNGVINRIKALRGYAPTRFNMRSRVVLCIPKEHVISDGSSDHGLSVVCGKDVELLNFEGNHLSILENVQLASTINSLLTR